MAERVDLRFLTINNSAGLYSIFNGVDLHANSAKYGLSAINKSLHSLHCLTISLWISGTTGDVLEAVLFSKLFE